MFFAFLSLCSWANDTHISFPAGSIAFYNENVEDPHISLEDETISIEMLPESFNIKVDYVFNNDGETVEYDIGFPVLNVSHTEENKKEAIRRIGLIDFKTSVNGTDTSFKKVAGSSDGKVACWYIKKVKFDGKAETKVNLSYTSPYGQSAYYRNVDYYYGSARTWKGSIKNLRIVFTNHSKNVVKEFYNPIIGHLPEIRVVGDATTTVEYKDIEPEIDAKMSFHVFHEKHIAWDFDEVQAELREEGLFNQNQLLFFNARQLRLLRSLIYALHGYIFKDKEFQEFFTENADRYDYKPQFENVDSKLRYNDQENINLINSLESRRQQK